MSDTYTLELIKHIRDYLDYLRNEHGLLTTYHLVEFANNARELGHKGDLDLGTIYREHTHPLCSYFKSKLSFWDHCIERQQKIVDKVQHGSFCGMCWAGLTEFIYPIRNSKGNITSFVCVSGYCVEREKAVPRIKHVCDTYNFSFEKAMLIFDNSDYNSLPSKCRLDTLIYPLCDMFSLLMTYLAQTKSSDKNVSIDINIGLYSSIRQYLETVYASNITIKDLCNRYNCSASYISRLLRKYGNTSFKKLVNTLRIDLACSMLIQTDYSIQYIAAATGFADANYFSTVFSKYKGMSPRDYRRYTPYE